MNFQDEQKINDDGEEMLRYINSDEFEALSAKFPISSDHDKAKVKKDGDE